MKSPVEHIQIPVTIDTTDNEINLSITSELAMKRITKERLLQEIDELEERMNKT